MRVGLEVSSQDNLPKMQSVALGLEDWVFEAQGTLFLVSLRVILHLLQGNTGEGKQGSASFGICVPNHTEAIF